MKTTFLLLFTFVLQLTAADILPGEKVLKEATDKFMTSITQKQFAEAVDALLGEYYYDPSDLIRTKASARAEFVTALAKAEINLGKPLPKGFEFLGVKRVGKSIVRFVYLQKFENFAEPWSFTFYKARVEFKLVSWQAGDSAGDDLKTFTVTESAR